MLPPADPIAAQEHEVENQLASASYPAPGSALLISPYTPAYAGLPAARQSSPGTGRRPPTRRATERAQRGNGRRARSMHDIMLNGGAGLKERAPTRRSVRLRSFGSPTITRGSSNYVSAASRCLRSPADGGGRRPGSAPGPLHVCGLSAVNVGISRLLDLLLTPRLG